MRFAPCPAGREGHGRVTKPVRYWQETCNGVSLDPDCPRSAVVSGGFLMRRGPRRLASLLVLATATLAGVAACGKGTAQPAPATGDFRDCSVHQNTCNSGNRIDGGTIVTVSEKDVEGWNLNDAAFNTLDFSQIMTGLMPTAFILEPDYSVALNTDLLESAEQTSSNPQTIVYKIKKQAVWNDGVPISADDFIWQWQTQSGTGD